MLIRLADELQPFRVGQGDAAAGRLIILLEQRRVLVSWSARLDLAQRGRSKRQQQNRKT